MGTLDYPDAQPQPKRGTLPYETTPAYQNVPDQETKGLYENYPTIDQYRAFKLAGTGELPLMNELALKWGTAFSSNPQQVTDIIKNNVPNARFTTDKYGNPMTELEGQKYYLDRPGLNTLDVTRGATKTMAALPLAAAAGSLAPVEAVGLPLALGAQALAGGASSAGEDLATIAAGSKQTIDYPKAALSAIVSAGFPLAAKGLGSLAQIMAPNVFSALPRGTQTFLKQYADQLRFGNIKVPEEGSSDLLLDDPRLRGIAHSIMREDAPAADKIESIIQQREATRPERVFSDVNKNLGKQTTTEQEVDQTLKGYRGVLSDELGPALKSAPDIDPSSVVSKIDSQLETAKGDVRNALINMRRMLVKDSGSPATQTIREPVIGPDGQTIRYKTTEGSPAIPPTYETSAQGLENARVAIDRMIKYGDETIGIKPNALPGKAGAIGDIRRDLSGLLKDNVDGYSGIMGRYSNLYDMIDANEAGSNIFARGANQIRPDMVKEFLSNPETEKAFRNGARAAWENKLRNSPNDVAALRSGMGGEGDYFRQNMEMIYGKDAVENLLSTAEREANYQKTAQSLLSSRESGMAQKGPTFLNETEQPVIKDVYGLPNRVVTGGVNYADKLLRGQSGQAYKEGLANVLTAQGREPIQAYKTGFEKELARQAKIRPLQTIAPALSGRVQDGLDQLGESTGGRIGRKSGGKVGGLTAESLLRDLKRRRVMLANKTEHMLSLPDDVVVQALDAAKR